MSNEPSTFDIKTIHAALKSRPFVPLAPGDNIHKALMFTGRVGVPIGFALQTPGAQLCYCLTNAVLSAWLPCRAVVRPTIECCAALAATNPSGLMGSDIPLPWPCVAVDISGWISDGPSVLWLLRAKCLSCASGGTQVVYDSAVPDGTTEDESLYLVWNVGDATFFHRQPLGRVVKEDQSIIPGGCQWESGEMELSMTLARFAISLLIYISQFRPSLKRERVRGRKAQRHGEPCDLSVWAVGSEIKLPAEMVQSSGDTSRAGHALRAQHVVRGHWRRQHYGPGLIECKVIWIKPYWQGPTGAPKIMPRYKVSGERDQ